MRLPALIEQFLAKHQAHCEILPYREGATLAEAATELAIAPECLLRVVSLSDENGVVLAILSSNALLDFDALIRECGRELDVMSSESVNAMFKGCAPNCRPALAPVFAQDALLDHQVLDSPFVYIESGTACSLLKFSQAEYRRLNGSLNRAGIAVSAGDLRAHHELTASDVVSDVVLKRFLPLRMKQRVQETYDLPAMPEIAQEIMRLRVDANATARDLANIVSRDPSLAAQVMSWANSPYYGFSGRIQSVENAIMRVLGFELVLNLALGIAVGRVLRVPSDGPLGLRAFWIQAVLSATLAERLATRAKSGTRPQRGLVYLAGLLHNIGHLFLGHVFPPQFYLLNRYVSANPDIPVPLIEQRVLGVTHNEIGAWLMQAWHMPEEIVAVTEGHHLENFQHPFAVYSHLVLIADRVLRRIGIGDAGVQNLPPELLASLQLSVDDIDAELLRINESRRELEEIATRMLAA